MRRLLTACCVLTGCGGDNGPASSPRQLGPRVELVEEAGDRAEVARVDGVPIYGDCVQHQAETTGGDRAAALQSCIDIEVLVAEARRRGLDADPEVAAAGEREMVRALLEREYYDKFTSPDDVPLDDVKFLWERGLKHHFNRVEHRDVFYCRAQNVDASRKTPPNTEAERKAKIVADAIYARLRGRTDLTPKEMRPLCLETSHQVGGADVSTQALEGFPKVGRLVPEFAEPAFAIKAVGRVGPPARTAWGYDIILLTRIVPPATTSFDKAAPTIRRWLFDDPRYEGYRKARFQKWLVDRTSGHQVERFDDNLPAEPLAQRAP